MNALHLSMLLSFVVFSVGCLQTENSSSIDGPQASGSLEFLAVSSAVKSKCSACHDFTVTTEAASQEFFVSSGRVIAGDPENSPLFYRLMGSSGSKGPKDMPASGSISQDEIEAIQAWITNMVP